ncbi:hypothetical protein XNA1_4200001 [Xenorhabdus nematophila str. Anatoliense]|nr:hypothetical protein XNA1_4200001 [Xenorhabdus nematophila str. Anatoliense]
MKQNQEKSIVCKQKGERFQWGEKVAISTDKVMVNSMLKMITRTKFAKSARD